MKLKVVFGIVVSLVFTYFAFRDTNFGEVWQALKSVDYIWLLPALLSMGLSHFLRAVRWHYLCEPIKYIKTGPLFSATMIGYAANNIFPLRLGEFFRAYALAQSQVISKTSVFATIIVDRLLDILSLVVLMAVSVYFLPENSSEDSIIPMIKQGGYFVSAGAVALIVVMILMMQKTDATLSFFSKFLPHKLFGLLNKTVRSFLQGFMVFKKAEHYIAISTLSILIWLLYSGTVFFSFVAFRFELGYGAAIVLLVIISLGLMIPSSPGFIGTYHLFCKAGLAIYAIGDVEAVSFAVISHAMNTVPFTFVGLYYFWRENLSFSTINVKEPVGEENNN